MRWFIAGCLMMLVMPGYAAERESFVQWSTALGPEGFPRTTFTRGESIPVRMTLQGKTGLPAGRVRLAVVSADTTWANVSVKVHATTAMVASVLAEIPVPALRRDSYQLTLEGTFPDQTLATSWTIRVASPPLPDSLAIGMWWENAYRKQQTEVRVSEYRDRGFNVMQVMAVYPALLDECLWQGIRCVSITHGQARGADGKTLETGNRLMADGRVYGADQQRPRWSLANTNWQDAMAASIGRTVGSLALHPAYWPMVSTSDDYFMWTGLDYHPENVRRFTEQTGREVPRPPEALAEPFPVAIHREPGVIADDDPWVCWLRFLCRDVLGRYNRRITDVVLQATHGRGAAMPLCGGGRENVMGFLPYVDVLTGQWPPYNFGAHGFNVLCCYNYNFYRYPALSQVWWYELGRMGNRDLPQWLMPETMDPRALTHIQNLYLYLAALQRGLMYFIYERTTPGAFEAFERVLPVLNRHGPLLVSLEAADCPTAILMPFEQACFNTDFPVDTQYAYANLRMAHRDVEPATPEELATSRYRTVLLAGIDWLTASSFQALGQFQSRGGIVCVDRDTRVQIPGAVRLDLSLGTGNRNAGYGNRDQIRSIRNAVDPHVPGWAQADDPHWFLRHCRLDGVDYLWVVNLMTREQDAAVIPESGQERRDPHPLPVGAGWMHDVQTARLDVAVGPSMVFDVFKGKPLLSRTDPDSGRLRVGATTGIWQGTHLAFYSSEPERLGGQASDHARAGRSLTLKCQVSDGKKTVEAPFTLQVNVTNPDGTRNLDYTGQWLMHRGAVRIIIPFAINDLPGPYQFEFEVPDCGLTAVQSVVLKGR